MIPKHIIDQIFEAARIEDVVADYVNLKKAGSNLKGLSPFVDEKTPSFMVSPAKQIFKDFSSGKGGNVVSFLMEHEQFSYPEALKFLAKRYNIEIPEEQELTQEQKDAQTEKESLFIVNQFAQEFFTNQLFDTDEGKSVGLSYFKERGFTEQTIKKFNLGYNPDSWETLVNAATEKGYKTEYLIKVGLAKQNNNKAYDTYRGRVIFPIHSLAGRVIGFGGRTLKADKNIPKYINSPESVIYNKSQTLYGIFYAKTEIIKQDLCYLVEGYTDVISLHQNGIENTVASSGTSLTEEQIRLIKRYTQNVVVLYDGDAAGIKASFRGTDMLLSQGLNVKVVLFPDGEDPDSFAKGNTTADIKNFLTNEAKDFIVFKTQLLSADSKNDPLQKAKLLKEVVHSISLIPDHITRAVYIKECSRLLEVEERYLVLELNKVRRVANIENRRKEEKAQQKLDAPSETTENITLSQVSVHVNEKDLEPQEREVMRLLFTYCNHIINPNPEDPKSEEVASGVVLVAELLDDGFDFDNPLYQKAFEIIKMQLEENGTMDENYFLVHAPDELKQLYIEIIKPTNELHNWERKEVRVKREKEYILSCIESALIHLRSKRIMKLISENDEKIKLAFQQNNDVTTLIQEKLKLNEIKKKLSARIGVVIR